MLTIRIEDIPKKSHLENENDVNDFSFKNEQEKTLGDKLLKEGLLEDFGIASFRIVYGENGKPYLDSGLPFFSISHSFGTVGIAINDEEIGFDLEMIGKRSLSEISTVEKRVFNENDYRFLEKSAAPETTSFLVIYTIKEAYSKYLGLGISCGLSNIQINYEKKTVTLKGKSLARFKSFLGDGLAFSIVQKTEPVYTIKKGGTVNEIL